MNFKQTLMMLVIFMLASTFSQLNFASTLEEAHSTHFNITLMDYPGAIERYGKPLAKAYQSLGIDVEFTKLGKGVTLEQTNLGKFDGDLMRAEGIEKSYANLIAVGQPLATANIVVLCQKYIACTNELLNSKKMEVHSVKGAKLWNKAIEETSVMVKHHASLSILKALFLAKKIDYMVFTLDDSGFFSADVLNATVMKEPLLTVKTHHYIHKKHIEISNELSKAINTEFQK